MSPESVEITGRTAFLTRYFDPGLDIVETSVKEIQAAQIERLNRALAVVVYASDIPRRLGKEATDADLALDKKRAKRVAWSLRQSRAGWSRRAMKLPEGEELRIEGAQLVWVDWYGAYMAAFLSAASNAITWSIRKDEQRWGRSAVVKFDNERNWVSYAMRD